LDEPAMMSAPESPARTWKIPRWTDVAFLAAGLALLLSMIARQPLGELGRACARIGPTALLTLIVALGWHACSAAALGVLLDGKIRWRTLLWVRLAGESYNALLVGVGGEPFRLRTLSRHVPADRVMTAMIRERVLDLAIGFVFSGAFLLAGVRRYPLAPPLRAAITLYALVTVGVAAVATAVVVSRIPGRAGTWLGRLFGSAQSGAATPLEAGRFLRVGALYLVARTLGLVEIGLLLRALGLDFGALTVGFIEGNLNASGTLAFMVPQAVGVFEGTSVMLFRLFGFAAAAGIAFALVRRARMLGILLVGIFLHWLGRDWHGSS
jgi:hypothetical protein